MTGASHAPARVRVVLLDIEGTVAPISFVHKVMFPYARTHLREFLEAHRTDAAVMAASSAILNEPGSSSDASAGMVLDDATLAAVEHRAFQLMDIDAKSTGLKQLQGMIWQAGFESGELRSPLFGDVAPVLRRLHAEGTILAIYSSGSVAAQKNFFAHTTDGDLTPLIATYFDTTTGPKRSPASYAAIAASLAVAAGSILFLSDVVEELDAARSAGLQTVLVVRPGNAPLVATSSHQTIASFNSLQALGPA